MVTTSLSCGVQEWIVLQNLAFFDKNGGFQTFQKNFFLITHQLWVRKCAFHNIVFWKRSFVCCYLRSFSWLSPLIAAVVSVSASVFQTKSTNHWVFPDSDIMKGSISLPKVIKVSFWEVWNSPFLSKKIPILQHYLLFDPAHLACLDVSKKFWTLKLNLPLSMNGHVFCEWPLGLSLA